MTGDKLRQVEEKEEGGVGWGGLGTLISQPVFDCLGCKAPLVEKGKSGARMGVL